MELDEGCTLQWFGQKIGDYFLCWAVFHNEINKVDVVSNKEVAHIEMSCMLGTQQSAILLKEDGTLVVLMEGGFIQIKALGMKKVVCPKQEWHQIISCDKFCLG